MKIYTKAGTGMQTIAPGRRDPRAIEGNMERPATPGRFRNIYDDYY
jgi:hypothetical protein